MNYYKKFSYILILTVILLIPGFTSETVNYTIIGDGLRSLTLINVTGDIEINGYTGSDIKIEVTKRGKSANFDKVEVQFVKENDLVIETVYQKAVNNVQVDYKIKVPKNIIISIENTTGDIEIAKIKNLSSLKATTGDIDITEIEEIGQLQTVTSDIEVTDSQKIDSIIVVTGDIIVKKAVSVTNLQTTTGDIEVDILGEQPETTLNTVTGNILAYIAEKSPQIESSVINGKILYNGIKQGTNGLIVANVITGSIIFFIK